MIWLGAGMLVVGVLGMTVMLVIEHRIWEFDPLRILLVGGASLGALALVIIIILGFAARLTGHID